MSFSFTSCLPTYCIVCDKAFDSKQEKDSKDAKMTCLFVALEDAYNYPNEFETEVESLDPLIKHNKKMKMFHCHKEKCLATFKNSLLNDQQKRQIDELLQKAANKVIWFEVTDKVKKTHHLTHTKQSLTDIVVEYSDSNIVVTQIIPSICCNDDALSYQIDVASQEDFNKMELFPQHLPPGWDVEIIDMCYTRTPLNVEIKLKDKLERCFSLNSTTMTALFRNQVSDAIEKADKQQTSDYHSYVYITGNYPNAHDKTTFKLDDTKTKIRFTLQIVVLSVFKPKTKKSSSVKSWPTFAALNTKIDYVSIKKKLQGHCSTFTSYLKGIQPIYKVDGQFEMSIKVEIPTNCHFLIHTEAVKNSMSVRYNCSNLTDGSVVFVNKEELCAYYVNFPNVTEQASSDLANLTIQRNYSSDKFENLAVAFIQDDEKVLVETYISKHNTDVAIDRLIEILKPNCSIVFSSTLCNPSEK